MPELERQLAALGAALEFPPTPALAARVRNRIEREPAGPAWFQRRALAAVLAALAVAIAAAFAVPQARTAILRFLGIGGVSIERVETLPPAQERPLTAGLGQRLRRTAAEQRAGFELRLPPFERGAVPRFYAEPGFAAVAFEHEGKPVLLVELLGPQLDFGKKIAREGTRIDVVIVGGRRGLWLEGAPHVVMWTTPDGRIRERTVRIAGNTLLWLKDGLTLRLEGDLTKGEALALATRIR